MTLAKISGANATQDFQSENVSVSICAQHKWRISILILLS